MPAWCRRTTTVNWWYDNLNNFVHASTPCESFPVSLQPNLPPLILPLLFVSCCSSIMMTRCGILALFKGVSSDVTLWQFNMLLFLITISRMLLGDILGRKIPSLCRSSLSCTSHFYVSTCTVSTEGAVFFFLNSSSLRIIFWMLVSLSLFNFLFLIWFYCLYLYCSFCTDKVTQNIQ